MTVDAAVKRVIHFIHRNLADRFSFGLWSSPWNELDIGAKRIPTFGYHPPSQGH